MPMRGKLIAIEGIDGAGTTTQVVRLCQWLRRRGYPVHATREPSDGPIGTLVRQALRGRVVVRDQERTRPPDPAALALLFAADRLDHVDAEIAPALAAGRVVVSDRYVYSSLAYQSVALPLSWVTTINARARRADCTILLQVRPEVGLQRLQQRDGDRQIYEHEAMLREVADRYAQLARTEPCGRVWVVDGEQDADAVAAQVQRVVLGALEQVGR